jgi:hypothetical protein
VAEGFNRTGGKHKGQVDDDHEEDEEEEDDEDAEEGDFTLEEDEEGLMWDAQVGSLFLARRCFASLRCRFVGSRQSCSEMLLSHRLEPRRSMPCLVLSTPVDLSLRLHPLFQIALSYRSRVTWVSGKGFERQCSTIRAIPDLRPL